MKRYLITLSLVVCMMSGCNKQFIVTELQQPNRQIQEFIENFQGESGNFLYFDGKNDIYVYINRGIVQQGEPASLLSEAQVDTDGTTLTFSFTEGKSIENGRHERIYHVANSKQYDVIQLLINGEEAGFHVMGG